MNSFGSAKDFLSRYKIPLYGLVVIALTGIYFRSIISELQPLENLREYRPTLSTKLYDINGQLVTEFFTERRTWVPLYRIRMDLQNAVLAIEDHRFFNHWGISFYGIVRAFVQNAIHRRIAAGGSTITQQLAKTAFLTQERTVTRKIKELILAIQLERNFSKQEILEMYLNQVYLGHGAYGVEQAAMLYFSKHAWELNLAECAALAGIVRSPSYFSLFNHPERNASRSETVLDQMEKYKYITQEEKKQAFQNPVALVKNSVPLPSAQAPYFVEYIRTQIEQEYGSEVLYNAGWKIYSTLDLQMQTTAEIVVSEFLSDFDKKRFELKKSTDLPPVQCALLALDPKTGQIRSMIGGRDFRKSQFNRAYQSMRQPGSSFKPIIYTAAIEKGYTPTTILEDAPLVYVNDGRDWRLKANSTSYLLTLPKEWLKDPLKVWVPENYKRKYFGRVLLRRAIELSMNMCAIRTIEEIGPTTVIEYARRLGIESQLTNTLSLALGASDVTMMEMTRAYNAFANRGILTKPYAIIRIEDSSGKVIKDNLPEEQDVLSEQTAYVLTNVLKGVIKEGTGQYAGYYLRRPAAGKTGTSNNFSDAWFIGYTPQLTCGVWVGYDDKRTLGDGNSGGAISCPIWTQFIKRALKGQPETDFPTPSTGVTFVTVDANTGYLATPYSKKIYTEAYISGTEPKTALLAPTTNDFLPDVKEEEYSGGF
ncbi:MAG: PBP1A family penicillin-binding protein [Elusimicrobiota bacterium]